MERDVLALKLLRRIDHNADGMLDFEEFEVRGRSLACRLTPAPGGAHRLRGPNSLWRRPLLRGVGGFRVCLENGWNCHLGVLLCAADRPTL